MPESVTFAIYKKGSHTFLGFLTFCTKQLLSLTLNYSNYLVPSCLVILYTRLNNRFGHPYCLVSLYVYIVYLSILVSLPNYLAQWGSNNVFDCLDDLQACLHILSSYLDCRFEYLYDQSGKFYGFLEWKCVLTFCLADCTVCKHLENLSPRHPIWLPTLSIYEFI